MQTYSQRDLLRVAKRVRNTKRSYLLVNPLQAKHIPVSPTESLKMMGSFGSRLAQKYPETRLVIGFAETATAIGAAIASQFSGCVYLQTTREDVSDVAEWILFSEEHSHAVEQKLCGDGLLDWIPNTKCVIFVDDEISTGQTLLNMILQLRERYPQLGDKQLVAASLLNRLSPEHERRLLDAGVHCEWLLRLSDIETVEDLPVQEAAPVQAAAHTFSLQKLDAPSLPDPRRGVSIQTYQTCCEQIARAFWNAADFDAIYRVIVLGTEECMYPALVLGQLLERQGLSVRCHATTRSPIGLCSAPDYPIASGHKLHSFYDSSRDTYLYNLAPCDALLVVSDTPSKDFTALNELSAAWELYGYHKLFFIQGGQYVWHL